MIEDLRPGDWVLSRDEYDPHGAVERKQVEEVFFRLGGIWCLHVNGEVIRTTGEHPFWVEGKGWTRANELSIGDKLLCEDGTYASVEDLLDTGDVEMVYNFRVADYHTYFVGCAQWGFSAWSHNVYDGPGITKPSGNKPPVGKPGGFTYIYNRYAYNAQQAGKSPKDMLSQAEYKAQHYDRVKAGDRPGR